MRHHESDSVDNCKASRQDYITTFEKLVEKRPFYTAQWCGTYPQQLKRTQVELNATNYSMSLCTLSHVLELSRAGPKAPRALNRTVVQPESLLTLLAEDDGNYTVSQSVITDLCDYLLLEDSRPARTMDFRVMRGVLDGIIESPFFVLVTGSAPPSS